MNVELLLIASALVVKTYAKDASGYGQQLNSVPIYSAPVYYHPSTSYTQSQTYAQQSAYAAAPTYSAPAYSQPSSYGKPY